MGTNAVLVFTFSSCFGCLVHIHLLLMEAGLTASMLTSLSAVQCPLLHKGSTPAAAAVSSKAAPAVAAVSFKGHTRSCCWQFLTWENSFSRKASLVANATK
jgi:hypothetical protein